MGFSSATPSEAVNTCAREVAHTMLFAFVDNVPCRDFLHPWYARCPGGPGWAMIASGSPRALLPRVQNIPHFCQELLLGGWIGTKVPGTKLRGAPLLPRPPQVLSVRATPRSSERPGSSLVRSSLMGAICPAPGAGSAPPALLLPSALPRKRLRAERSPALVVF